MPRLTIVIPSLGGAEEFETTLASVLQNRPADCEVLVVHRGSYEDPYALAGEVRFLQAEKDSVVGQINRALREAAGTVVHVLRCGLETTEGWADAALPHFANPEVAAVAPLVLADDRQRWVAAGIRWTRGGRRQIVADPRIAQAGHGRLRASLLGPTLLAGFYRREVLCALDGFDPRVGDCLADVEMALALRDLEMRAVCEPACQLIQVEPPVDIPSTPFRLGWGEEHLFWRSVPRPLEPTSLAWHLLTAAGAVLHGALRGAVRHAAQELAGRLTATCNLAQVSQHRQRLARAAQRLDDVATLRSRTQRRADAMEAGQTAWPEATHRRAA